MSRKMWILDGLGYRFRAISWPQLIGMGPPSKAYERNLRRLVRGLEDAELIRRLMVLARPTPVIDKPLAVWRVGEPPPDFHAIQYQAEQRNLHPVETVTVFLGTKRLANALGGTCGHKLNHHSLTHDLGVTSVYQHYWKTAPDLALAWQGEDIIAPSRQGQKLPDAMLFNRSGEPMMAIEFIGDYPVERVISFHNDAVSRETPYEVY